MKRLLLFLLLFFSIQNVHALSVDDLSLEDKVGQLLMVWFDGVEVNEDAQKVINQERVGAIIYYQWANGLTSPSQVKSLSKGLQALAIEANLPPLLIAIDEEGGAVSYLTEGGFTDFPGNGALGRTGRTSLAFKEAEAIGTELKAAGINMNLAPVVDVNNNPNNPIIGIRSFGDSPEMVAQFSEEALKGYLKSGVIPCLKHFPGHGDVSIDTHEDLPVVNKTLDELEKMELLPYIKLAKQTPCIMTSHILFPKLDPKHPATLSKIILQDILRKKLGFEGVIITDSLTMQGILKDKKGISEVALEAFLAGGDIFIIGGNPMDPKKGDKTPLDKIEAIQTAFLDAINQGLISMERLDASVERILKLKETKGLLESPPLTPEMMQENLKLAREIAYNSVEVKKGKFPIDLKTKRVAIFAPSRLEAAIPSTDLARIGKEREVFYFDVKGPTDEEASALLKKFDQFDFVIMLSYNAWKFPKQLRFLKSISAKQPFALIATADVRDLDLFPSARLQIATYSPSLSSLSIAAEFITGALRPLRITPREAVELGNKVWKNESNQSTEMLTFWSEKEEFPSMGIGHFTWPPQNYKGIFSEGRFHEVLTYLKSNGVKLPFWLEECHYSPWTSRNEFYKEIDSKKMKDLRSLLSNTIPLQACYMAEKLGETFLNMLSTLSLQERKHLTNQFFRIANTPQGPYILIDYLNFKGEGISPKARYNNEGWGLIQVLQMMGDEDNEPAQEFASCAEHLLKKRIANSPPKRNEAKWLPGWQNRLKTYTATNN